MDYQERVERKKSLMLKILDDTVAYYNEHVDHRSITFNDSGDHDGCLYKGRGEKRCAVGRLMHEAVLGVVGASPFNGAGLKNLLERDLTVAACKAVGSFFADKEYDEISYEFYLKLQSLHDIQGHWNKSGITSSGMFYAETLRLEIKKGHYTHDENTIKEFYERQPV